MCPLYDRIGFGYDETRHADPRIAERLASHLNLSFDGTYVDVACGTGNYTTLLASRGGRWIGIDCSSQMLLAARDKTTTVTWCLGDASQLPLRTGMAAGAVCGQAIHHFPDLHAAFAEVARVTAHGRFVIFTSTREQLRGYWLNHYFPDAMMLSMKQTPSLCDIESTLKSVGFRDVSAEPFEAPQDITDLFLYAGKHRPALYLQEEIRRNISTFRTYADASEVATGVTQLSSDIASGQIERIMGQYAHTGGDYLFVTATGRGRSL